MKSSRLLKKIGVTLIFNLIIPIIVIDNFIKPASAQGTSSWLNCRISGLESGQLLVRSEPAGEPFTSLNNGDIVQALVGTGKFVRKNGIVWYYVKIIQESDSAMNGRIGWVSSDYLACERP